MTIPQIFYFYTVNFLKNPLSRFLITALLLYIGWYCVYEFWLHPMQSLDLFVVQNTIDVSEFFLRTIGCNVSQPETRLLQIEGTGGLFIGDHCNGIPLFALFAIFIIAFPGPWKKKILFVSAGITLIHFANIMRIIALALIQKKNNEWVEFNHTYTFTILMYAFILGMWMMWVKKYSGIPLKTSEK